MEQDNPYEKLHNNPEVAEEESEIGKLKVENMAIREENK